VFTLGVWGFDVWGLGLKCLGFGVWVVNVRGLGD
jgi:hypothetical protein